MQLGKFHYIEPGHTHENINLPHKVWYIVFAINNKQSGGLKPCTNLFERKKKCRHTKAEVYNAGKSNDTKHLKLGNDFSAYFEWTA